MDVDIRDADVAPEAPPSVRLTTAQVRAVRDLAVGLPFDWTLTTIQEPEAEGGDVLLAVAHTRPRPSNYVISRSGGVGAYSRAAREYLGLPNVERERV